MAATDAPVPEVEIGGELEVGGKDPSCDSGCWTSSMGGCDALSTTNEATGAL